MMPRPRQTCTRCSMRRQRCDRGLPCARCVKAGVAAKCSRDWKDGYHAHIHRQYPKVKSTVVAWAANVSRPSTQALSDSSSQSPPSPHDTVEDNSIQATPLSLANTVAHETTQTPFPTPPSEVENRCCNAPQRRSISNNLWPPIPHGHTVEALNVATLDYLQKLLPTYDQASALVKYHTDFLNFYHWCLTPPFFEQELRDRAINGTINLAKLDLQWAGLLFAVLASSVTCAPHRVTTSWGLSRSQKSLLGRSWFEASLTCLTLGDCLAKPHINSAQAILALSLCAHVYGLSSKLFILCGTAIRIAQSLGLHKLSYDSVLDAEDYPNKNETIQRETGRRVWSQLCIYDWCGVVSCDMYLIHRQDYTTVGPRRIDDDTGRLSVPDRPARTDFGRWISGVAELLVDFHDTLNATPDMNEKYSLVLLYDSKLRAFGQKGLLSIPASSGEPEWARWAREEQKIILQNKISFVHRTFLVQSFTDPTYEYTRWASLNAAYTVVKAVDLAFENQPERPSFWSDQAYIVGACITLCLDIFHRREEDVTSGEHRKVIRRALRLLDAYHDSLLAMRGVHLITTLLNGGRRHLQAANWLSNAQSQNLAWPLDYHLDAAWLGPPASAPPAPQQQQPQPAVIGPELEYSSPRSLDDQRVLTSDMDSSGMEMWTETCNDDVLSDLSWLDTFSQYFPPQSGLDSGLMHDIFRDVGERV